MSNDTNKQQTLEDRIQVLEAQVNDLISVNLDLILTMQVAFGETKEMNDRFKIGTTEEPSSFYARLNKMWDKLWKAWDYDGNPS